MCRLGWHGLPNDACPGEYNATSEQRATWKLARERLSAAAMGIVAEIVTESEDRFDPEDLIIWARTVGDPVARRAKYVAHFAGRIDVLRALSEVVYPRLAAWIDEQWEPLRAAPARTPPGSRERA